MKANWITVLTNILYGMIGAVIVLGVAHWINPPAKPVAVVNLTGLVNGYIKEMAKMHLPKNIEKRQVKLFASQLEISIKQMSQKKNVVIMPAEAVIAGSQNLTSELLKNISAIDDMQKLMGQSNALQSSQTRSSP